MVEIYQNSPREIPLTKIDLLIAFRESWRYFDEEY